MAMFDSPRPNTEAPTVISWGFFLSICASSRVLLGVPAEACGLRQPPKSAVPGHIALSPGHSSLRPSLPGTGPKSAKAATQAHTDQRVTRGRIKRLDCSIGYRSGQTSLAQSQQPYRAFYSIRSNSFCAASLAAASCAGASGSRSTPSRPAT